jgi:hypothetical protein
MDSVSQERGGRGEGNSGQGKDAEGIEQDGALVHGCSQNGLRGSSDLDNAMMGESGPNRAWNPASAYSGKRPQK